MATFSALNTFGDVSAQTIESRVKREKTKYEYAFDRIGRYMFFGLFDGFVNHFW